MGRRVLLAGPPAVGKSSVAKHLLTAFPECAYLDLDGEIRRISIELGRPHCLSDEQIDEAVRRLCIAAEGDSFVLELPHHDYLKLIQKGLLSIEYFDCIAILVADYQTLTARERKRAHSVPLDYIARCAGASNALICYLEGKYSPWVTLNTQFGKPALVANCIVDFVRRNESASLAMISVAPSPARGHIGGNLRDTVEWDQRLVNMLLKRWHIRTALDIGCGNGESIRKFADLGIKAWGIDGYLADSERSSRIVAADFTCQWIEWPVKADLVWCVEVLEHVPQHCEMNVVRSIVHNTGKIAFVTAAAPGQPGYHHVNCQPQTYWIDRFQSAGLRYVDDTKAILDQLEGDGPFGTNVFKENGMIFEVST